MRMMPRATKIPAVAVQAVTLAVMLGGLSACAQSDAEIRDAYCAQLEEDKEEISRLASEDGAGGFIRALPILDGLGELAPGDIKDEWQLLLNALHGLDDALEETGLEPADVDGELPESLTDREERLVTGAASVLASADVRAATSGIEQHALDICETPLL